MEVCQSQSSHHSSMSFLDQIFGTDGRKHKEDGVWNWLKHQKNKKSNKARDRGGELKISTARDESASGHPRQHYHSRSSSRSSNLSTATTVTPQPAYLCRTPTSPTSTFVPSCSSSFSSFSSSSTSTAIATSSSAPSSSSSPSSPVTASSSCSPVVLAGALSKVNTTPTTALVCPAGLQQQPRSSAQSNFTLPGSSTPVAPLSTTMIVPTSQQQRPTFSSASSLSYSSGYDQVLMIRRSASAGSSPSARFKGKEVARDYQQEQPRRQRWSSGAASFVSSRASPRIPEEGEEGGDGAKSDEWWWE